MKKVLWILLAATICVACAKKAEKTDTVSAEEPVVEEVVVEETIAEEPIIEEAAEETLAEEVVVEEVVEEVTEEVAEEVAEEVVVEEAVVEEPVEEPVLKFGLDVQPEYPGGLTEAMKVVAANTKYPAEAKANGWEGKVICTLIVEKDGSVSSVKVMRSSGYTVLDDEAVRAFSTLSNWAPGQKDGKPVRAQVMLPLQFKL
jgi:protein TonB